MIRDKMNPEKYGVYAMAAVDSVNSRLTDVEKGILAGTSMVKGAASHRINAITGAAGSLGKSIANSTRRGSKEASQAVHSLGEAVDIKEIRKSLHKIIHPGEHDKRPKCMVHTPIDSSKKSKLTSQELAVKASSLHRDMFEDSEDGEASSGYDNTTESVEEKSLFSSFAAKHIKPEVVKSKRLPWDIQG